VISTRNLQSVARLVRAHLRGLSPCGPPGQLEILDSPRQCVDHLNPPVIVTNRLGKVAQRNAFGDRRRQAVAEARTCGKPFAPPSQGGWCGETCADPSHCLPKGTRFHDLRHFYASTLIAASLNPKMIQARLGHATITETMDTYGHLFPDAEDVGRGAIDAIFAVAATEQRRNQEAR